MEKNTTKPLSISLGAGFLLFIAGVILPVTDILLSIMLDGVGPYWQSGEFKDYLRLVLRSNSTYIFWPFLAYAMLSTLLLLSNVKIFSRFFIVRLGVYSGVLLSLVYAVILGGIWSPNFIIIFIVIFTVSALIKFLIALAAKSGKRPAYLVAGGIILIGIAIYLSYIRPRYHFVAEKIFFHLLVAVFGCAPCWAFGAYLWLAIKIHKASPLDKLFNPIKIVFVISWITAYIVAWRLAVAKMVEIYFSLPKTAPCYICTAAAKGHPEIVNSFPVVIPGNHTLIVNRQMQYLKCGELVMMRTMPAFHYALRKSYDSIGPYLARLIINPLVADVVYFSIKPIEWGVRLCLKLLIPNTDELAGKIYK